MKKCPQCNSVFDDSLVFCTNDRTPLVDEAFVMPSELTPADAEQETVIRHEPLHFDIPQASPQSFGYQTPPVQPPPKQRNFGKYLMFLILGIVLGAGVVLAIVIGGIYFFQRTLPSNSNTARATPTPVVSQKTASPPAISKHAAKTDKPDEDFNGRVIATTGRVRMLPNKTGTEVDSLPKNDRIDIEQRASETSPWYRVTCEHGTSGWIHGNEIEYNE